MSIRRSKTYKVIFDIITGINITLILKKYWRFQNDWHLNNYILYLRPQLWCSAGCLRGCWPSASWNGGHCVPSCKIPKRANANNVFQVELIFIIMRTLYIFAKNFYGVEFTQFSSDMCTIPQKEKAYSKQIFSTMCMFLYILFLFHNS